jgi:hypothetical protein
VCVLCLFVTYSPPNLRGVNILEVDVLTCRLIATRQFDTFLTTSNAASDLASYLHNVADDTVLVGVTAFDPMTNVFEALDSLSSLGVFVNDVQAFGGFAFVAQKGKNSKTILKKSVNASEPAAVLQACVSGKT